MVYDRDLKITAWGIVVVSLLNIVLAVICVFRGQWIAAAACLIWCANLRVWWGVNRNHQRQRDRNREIEAAIMKALVGQFDTRDRDPGPVGGCNIEEIW